MNDSRFLLSLFRSAGYDYVHKKPGVIQNMKRALIFIGGLVAAVVLTPVVVFVWWFAVKPMFYPPAPPLLEHVTAAGGWFGGCPPRNQSEADMRATMGEALSPELNRKLTQQFPQGSPAETLVRALTQQGFELAGSCPNDSTINNAMFHGPARSAIFEIRAVVFWKTQDQSLVWTKGFVSFDGL